MPSKSRLRQHRSTRAPVLTSCGRWWGLRPGLVPRVCRPPAPKTPPAAPFSCPAAGEGTLTGPRSTRSTHPVVWRNLLLFHDHYRMSSAVLPRLHAAGLLDCVVTATPTLFCCSLCPFVTRCLTYLGMDAATWVRMPCAVLRPPPPRGAALQAPPATSRGRSPLTASPPLAPRYAELKADESHAPTRASTSRHSQACTTPRMHVLNAHKAHQLHAR